ncbi:MAG TPA: prolipoprotein diacylglyceryl transferase [Planctomycetota bacterium]|nr:prolipoprotein diacylglyceryl transferase [Planctomycetota bacterium]
MQFPAWDPVLFDIPGLPIDIRWYGMMYVVGFVIGQWILVRLARAHFFPGKPELAADLIFYLVLGVMLGGRTGYALWYQPDLLNPLQFIQVWKGGLAFHGGVMGVAVALWLFARRHKLGWRRVGDACALAVTPGILAVRFANFINGELYGRVTGKGVFGAMQFPTDPTAEHLLGISNNWSMRDRELCIQVAFGKRTFADVKDQLSTVDELGNKIDWALVEPKLHWAKVSSMTDASGLPVVPYRHPSQIYEGLGEGLVLGCVLLLLYLATRRRPLRTGYYAVVFLLGYAAIRWSLELVREPDAQFRHGNGNGTVFAGMTMGQTLSLGLVVVAILIVVWPRRGEGAIPPGLGGNGSARVDPGGRDPGCRGRQQE